VIASLLARHPSRQRDPRASSVESDHPAIRGAVIAFITVRSRQRRAWIPPGGKHERRRERGNPGPPPLPSRDSESRREIAS